jgi:hypothetical protein
MLTGLLLWSGEKHRVAIALGLDTACDLISGWSQSPLCCCNTLETNTAVLSAYVIAAAADVPSWRMSLLRRVAWRSV